LGDEKVVDSASLPASLSAQQIVVYKHDKLLSTYTVTIEMLNDVVTTFPHTNATQSRFAFPPGCCQKPETMPSSTRGRQVSETKVPCRWQETAGYGRIMGQPERSWQRVRCSETSSPDSDGVEWIRMVQRWVEMCKDLPNFFKILKPHQLCRIPTCCSRTGSAALAKARAALAHGIYHVEYGHMPSKQELSQWLYLLLAKSL
jgi:hypothetical protein